MISGLEHARSDRVTDHTGRPGYAEFTPDVLSLKFDRFLIEIEARARLLRGQIVGDAEQNLNFSLC